MTSSQFSDSSVSTSNSSTSASNSSASTSSNSSMPTIGQLERNLSQKIRALHRDQLGQQPSKVTCQLLETKLAIIIEDSVTKPEQLLAEEGQEDLAEQVRQDLDRAIEPQLKDLIQEILMVKVIDFLSDSTLETGRAGIIVILDSVPETRPARTK